MNGTDVSEMARTLEAFPLFSSCAPDVRKALVRGARRREVKPRELVLQEGDTPTHVFALIHGAVSVFYTSDFGAHLVAKLFSAPAFFGEMEVLVGIPHLESVEALRRCELLAIERAAFIDALAHSRELAVGLAVDLSARLCIAAKNERAIAFDQVEARLATLMLSYADVFGANVGGGTHISLEVTQEKIADNLGISRKSVQRTFLSWQKKGLLARSGRHFVLPDVERLRALAGELPARVDYRLGEIFGRKLTPP
jgi:CRP-like cAMP-binding protein